jgi:hypothetical protein
MKSVLGLHIPLGNPLGAHTVTNVKVIPKKVLLTHEGKHFMKL